MSSHLKSQILSGITLIVGLAVTNGLITNGDGKIITGAASGLVALGFLIYGAIVSHGHSKIAAAKILAGTPNASQNAAAIGVADKAPDGESYPGSH
jgi:hypothetical protein